jgi:hypothetical protein
MPPDSDVSHRDIYVRLAELGGDIKTLLGAVVERKEDVIRLGKDLDALFVRQRALETRVGQVVAIGALVALLVPVLGNAMHIRLALPMDAEQRQHGAR